MPRHLAFSAIASIKKYCWDANIYIPAALFILLETIELAFPLLITKEREFAPNKNETFFYTMNCFKSQIEAGFLFVMFSCVWEGSFPSFVLGFSSVDVEGSLVTGWVILLSSSSPVVSWL